jgi:hypothetical protein
MDYKVHYLENETGEYNGRDDFDNKEGDQISKKIDEKDQNDP